MLASIVDSVTVAGSSSSGPSSKSTQDKGFLIVVDSAATFNSFSVLGPSSRSRKLSSVVLLIALGLLVAGAGGAAAAVTKSILLASI